VVAIFWVGFLLFFLAIFSSLLCLIKLAGQGAGRKHKKQQAEEDPEWEWNHQVDITPKLFSLMRIHEVGSNREAPKIAGIGDASAGKGATGVTLGTKTLEDPSYKFCAFSPSDKFVGTINDAQEAYANENPEFVPWGEARFYETDRLDKVDNRSYLYIDEGEMEAGNMSFDEVAEALIYAANIMSHKGIVVYICSQNERFKKGLRDKINVWIYKRLSTGFIDDGYYYKPPFVLKYGPKFANLDVRFGFVDSHFSFGNWRAFSGVLHFDLFQEVPWWNHHVSENYADMSLSQLVNNYERLMKEVPDLANCLLERFGSGRFAGKRKVPLRAVRGWIRRNYGAGDALHYTQYPLFDYILDDVALTSFEAKEADEEEGESISMKSRIPQLKPSRCFSDFFEENGQLPQLERAIVAEFLRQSSTRHIANEVTKELGMEVTPYEVRQLLGTKGKITATNGRIARLVGDAFEWWCAIQIGVPPEDVPLLCAADDSTPDLIWEDEIYSFKWRNNAADRKLKWTRADTPPEWAIAEKEQKLFHFVETNLGWGFNVRMVDVDPSAQELEWHTTPQMSAWTVTEA